jgi:hypothetical protein
MPKQPNGTRGKKPPAPSVKVRPGDFHQLVENRQAESLDKPMPLSRTVDPRRFPHVAAWDRMATMPRSDEPIRPMSFGNMRSLGVRSLFTIRPWR